MGITKFTNLKFSPVNCHTSVTCGGANLRHHSSSKTNHKAIIQEELTMSCVTPELVL